MPTAAGYIRVSSSSQDASMQREAIDRARRARKDGTCTVYEDVMTGGTNKRPALEALRSDVRRGLITRIYVWRLDRLTRTGIRDTLDLVEEFTRHGAELVSLADGFDLAGPAAEIVLAVLAWAAKMERLAIRERLDEARARSKANGTSWGRPNRMNRQQVKDARAMHECGRSVREIAVALKNPKSTIMRAIAASRKLGTKAHLNGPRKALPRRR